MNMDALDARTPNTARRIATCIALTGAGLALVLLFNACGTAQSQKVSEDKALFHYKLANNYFYDRNTVMAMRECHAALEHDADHADTHHLLGFLFFGRKQYAEAVSHFQKAIASKKADGIVFYEAVANLGAVYLAQKRWHDAIEQFDALTREQLYPAPSLAHVNLGWAYYNLKRHSDALQHYRMALFLNPKLCLGYNNLGLLYEAMRDESRALETFQLAIERCPKYAEPHFHVGRLLSQQGQSGLAIEAFARCHELEPDSQLGRRCAARKL